MNSYVKDRLTLMYICIESKDYFHSTSPVARLYQPQAVGFSACLDRLIVCDTILFLLAIYMIRCYGTVDGLCVVWSVGTSCLLRKKIKLMVSKAQKQTQFG